MPTKFNFGARWVIYDDATEGSEFQQFGSVGAIHRAAVSKGFKGAQSTLHMRILRLQEKGRVTWAQLLKPLSDRWKGMNEERVRAVTQRLDPEIISAIANVERRRREISKK